MKKNEKTALILNIVLVISGVCGFALMFSKGFNLNYFCYFTVLSNLFALITSLLYVSNMLSKKNQKEIPAIVMYLRYFCTCYLTITLIVAYCVLAPMSSADFGGIGNAIKEIAIGKELFFFHTLSPIISFVSFELYEGDRRLNKKKTINYAMIFPIVYALIFIALNCLGKYTGPYPFFIVSNFKIYVLLIMYVALLVGTYVLNRVILLYNQMHATRR